MDTPAPASRDMTRAEPDTRAGHAPHLNTDPRVSCVIGDYFHAWFPSTIYPLALKLGNFAIDFE